MYGDGVGLKLPPEVIRRLDGRPGIAPIQPYGKPKMKEWIHIRHDRAQSYARDARLFQASMEFVRQTVRRLKKSPASKRPSTPL